MDTLSLTLPPTICNWRGSLSWSWRLSRSQAWFLTTFQPIGFTSIWFPPLTRLLPFLRTWTNPGVLWGHSERLCFSGNRSRGGVRLRKMGILKGPIWVSLEGEHTPFLNHKVGQRGDLSRLELSLRALRDPRQYWVACLLAISLYDLKDYFQPRSQVLLVSLRIPLGFLCSSKKWALPRKVGPWGRLWISFRASKLELLPTPALSLTCSVCLAGDSAFVILFLLNIHSW